MSRFAYETIKELMIEAVGDQQARRGLVAVPQTFGSLVNPHPHIHCLASRGVWDDQARWSPIAYLDTHAAEKLFARKVLHLLQAKGLLSEERIELLTSFTNSGFSVDASPTVWPSDTQGIERLSRYLLRCPYSILRGRALCERTTVQSFSLPPPTIPASEPTSQVSLRNNGRL